MSWTNEVEEVILREDESEDELDEYLRKVGAKTPRDKYSYLLSLFNTTIDPEKKIRIVEKMVSVLSKLANMNEKRWQPDYEFWLEKYYRLKGENIEVPSKEIKLSRKRKRRKSRREQ